MTTDQLWEKILQEIELVNDGVISKDIALSWIQNYINIFKTQTT